MSSIKYTTRKNKIALVDCNSFYVSCERLFNPIIQKNYFDKYDLSIFKNKKFRTHVFGMGGSSLSAKLLCQFLDPYSLGKNLFIYDNPSLVMIENTLLDLNISNNDKFIFI